MGEGVFDFQLLLYQLHGWPASSFEHAQSSDVRDFFCAVDAVDLSDRLRISDDVVTEVQCTDLSEHNGRLFLGYRDGPRNGAIEVFPELIDAVVHRNPLLSRVAVYKMEKSPDPKVLIYPSGSLLMSPAYRLAVRSDFGYAVDCNFPGIRRGLLDSIESRMRYLVRDLKESLKKRKRPETVDIRNVMMRRKAPAFRNGNSQVYSWNPVFSFDVRGAYDEVKFMKSLANLLKVNVPFPTFVYCGGIKHKYAVMVEVSQ